MLRCITTLCALLVGGACYAERIENFVLLDQHGTAHNLYYHKDKAAIVIMIQGNGCPIVRNALTDYKALRDSYANDNVHFLMLNSNLQDQRASILAEAQRFAIDLPILHDETQLVGEALGLVRTAEVLVIDPSTWTIAYRGPINDRQVYERQKNQAANHYVADAIASVLAGEQVAVPKRDTLGCLINFAQSNADHSQISYADTIAPILLEKCVVCHTEGGLGPWAMSSYAMVRGFAPMMREVIRTKRMPPWHADPHIGKWRNDKSLSVEQTQALVHWIEAGAPRGNGADPLENMAVAQVEWPLGEPHLIVDIPAYTIPASGVVEYKFPRVANPLQQGVWVKAATVIPGNREVVHHILAGSIDAGSGQAERDSGVFDNYLIGYAPGSESNLFPDDTGVYIAPGGEFAFQLHYTPIGREIVDASRIGLYFHSSPPSNFYRQSVVIDPTIEIPPNSPRHAERAYFTFDQPALLHDLIPHAHYRGVASQFELQDAAGQRTVLLSVPNYDFNWQRTYTFAEPVAIAPGSKLIHTTWYDNSAANPGNPNPERAVPWGLQSWDEMLYGAFSYTLVGETSDAPILDKTLVQTTRMVGFMDENMDGKLSWQELPRTLKRRLVQGFRMVDSNADGGLDIQELYRLSQRVKDGDAGGG